MMTIKQIEVTVGQIAEGYINNDEQGVRGYGGKLDIRPPYQREFIYNDKEQQAVITTVLNGYLLNVMYWVKRSDDAGCLPPRCEAPTPSVFWYGGSARWTASGHSR